MMSTQESKPPAGPATYTTDRSEERGAASEVDPESILRPGETRDLRTFFCEGVASTFGRQLEAALAQRISDASMQDARMIKALRTRLRKGWKPDAASAKRKKRRAPITEVFLEHVGVALDHGEDVGNGDGGWWKGAGSEWRGLVDESDQQIYMHSSHTMTLREPSDLEIKRARALWNVATRLHQIDPAHRETLKAKFGLPSGEWPAPMCEEDYVERHGDSTGFRFNSPRATAEKKFGDLLEIVVCLVREDREPGTTLATRTILARINDDAFVRAKRHAATMRLRAAAKSYAETRP